MILAWLIFTSVGITTARYYKSVWADKTFLKLKVWFQVGILGCHICSMYYFVFINL